MSEKLYLYKRNNGIYYIGYLEGNHKRWKSTGEKTKPEALKVLKNFEEHLQQNKLPDPTFEQFINQFNQLRKNSLSENTLFGIYRFAFNSFLEIVGNKPLSQYTLRDVEHYKSVKLEQKLNPSSINRYCRILQAAFRFAIKWQLIKENPFNNSPYIRTPEKLPAYLSRTDFQKILNATKEQVLKDIYLFAVLTGMRKGEILNLRWNAVNLHQKLITVENTAKFKTKTGRIRILPMSEAVYQMLLRRSTLKGNQELVFHKNGFPLSGENVKRKFKKTIKILGLNKALHFHSLRHTFATWLVQEGVSLYEIQKLLGHSNINATQIYSHLQPEKLHATVNRISIPLN